MLNGILHIVSVFPFVEVGIVAVLLLSGFGIPIPEDIPLLLGGFFCSKTGGALSHLWLMIPLTYAAVIGADLIVFSLGWRFGRHVIALPVLRHILIPARIARAEEVFARHGGKTLFAARFMPGLRSAVFISAGICRTPLWKMLVFDGGAGLLSVPLWVWVGYAFGEHIPQIHAYASRIKTVLLIAVALIVLVALVYQLRQHRRAVAKPRRTAHAHEA
jgi:membrane protein DedA with SNARE-associated domain